MQRKGLSLEEAVEELCKLHKTTVDRFLYLSNNLGTLLDVPEEVSKDVRHYVFNILGPQVRGNVEWGFATGRYFGSEGERFRSARMVPIAGQRGNGADRRAAVSVAVPLRT